MALITKDKRDWAHVSWPNPYHLTKEDAKGKLKDVPLEVITLILKEMVLQGKKDCLYKAQNLGISSNKILDWDKTKDGNEFWSIIWYIQRYDVFYDKYTPETLRKRLKE